MTLLSCRSANPALNLATFGRSDLPRTYLIKSVRALSLLLLLTVLFLRLAVADEVADRASFAANQVFDSVKKLDAKGVANWLPPDVKHALDGEENAIKTIEAVFDGGRKLGLNFEKSKLGKPDPVTRAGELLFVFFPYTFSAEKDGKVLTVSSFYIVISYDQGKEWYVVDGMRADASIIKTLIPDYDGQPPIPKSERSISERK
jgi:hypothetical protein